MRVVYIAGVLPTRSETFVYREIFELEDRGVGVVAVSLRGGDVGLGGDRLDRLAGRAIVVYPGVVVFGWRVLCGFVRRPVRSALVFLLGVRDAAFERDVVLSDRPKVLLQALAAIGVSSVVSPMGFDRVHAHFAHAPATVGMYLARLCGVPFSFTGHANDLFARRSLLRVKLARAAFVACISVWHRGFYGGVLGGGEEAVRFPVIRCGVDVGGTAERERSGVVGVGRLVAKKGFDELIRSVAIARERGEGFAVTIVGDGPEAGRLRALSAELGVGDLVRFVGAVGHAEALRWVRGASVVCLPCRFDASGDRDGIPVALMEGMAAGACAVSGDLPAIRELIGDGETGRLVEPGDAAGLAGVLAGLLGDPSGTRRLAERGRLRVLEEFSTSVNVDRLMDAFGCSDAVAGVLRGDGDGVAS